jgi:hypothetical protein
MGTAATIANVPETLKNIWEDEVHDFLFDGSTWFGQCPKAEDWDGDSIKITVMYGGMNGRSAKFANAQNRKSPPKYKQMDIESRDNFALWSVDHKLIIISRNKRGALVRQLADNTKLAMTRLKYSTSWMLWGNGGGAAGKISSVVGTAITLTDKNDVRNWEVGDFINAATTDGTSGSLKLNGGSTASTEITAINEDTGVLTTANDTTGYTTAWAANDFLFHDGDFGAVFHGVKAFVTPSAPGTGGVPASIHGMDRTAHLTRLGGHRFTATTGNVADEIMTAVSLAGRRNCNFTDLYAPPEVCNEVEIELQGSKRYTTESVGRVGYQAIEFTTLDGKVVKLWSDSFIPKSPNGKRVVYGLRRDSFKFHTALSYPMWLTIDGSKVMDMERDANQFEGRIGGYGEFYCTAPGDNFVLELTV